MKLKQATHTHRFRILFGDDGDHFDLTSSVVSLSPTWNVTDGFTVTVVIRDTVDNKVAEALDDIRASGLSQIRVETFDNGVEHGEKLRTEIYSEITVKAMGRSFDYRRSEPVTHTVVFAAGDMSTI